MSDALDKLAAEAIAVQDACNLSGLAIRFANVVVELRALLQDVPEFETEMINRHPIVTLWVMKMADLNGCAWEADAKFSAAYDWCIDGAART